jgi:hypothetical protein
VASGGTAPDADAAAQPGSGTPPIAGFVIALLLSLIL